MMPARKGAIPFATADALIGSHATNNRINVYLVQNLPEEAWRGKPPGAKGRDIAAIVAQIHNTRLMWLNSAGGKQIPPKLDPETVTRPQAVQALEESWKAVEETLRTSLDGDARIKDFKPDVVNFFSYLLAQDAHHRGQIAMMAGLAGHPVSKSVMLGLWEWRTR
jgi:uncharacterized damage-inducible protein DinB